MNLLPRYLKWLALAQVLGCGGNGTDAAEGAAPELEDVTAVSAESVFMPLGPQARRGQLAASGRGVHEFDGEWKAQGGFCDDPTIVQLVTDAPAVGVLVVVRLESDEVKSRFLIASDSLLPPGASRVAVRVSRGRSAFALLASEGEVELTRSGNRVSGGFEVSLYEVAMETSVLAAGTFRDVSVRPLPEAQCEMVRAAWVVSDSAVGPTAPGLDSIP